jgi:hypothetical protein
MLCQAVDVQTLEHKVPWKDPAAGIHDSAIAGCRTKVCLVCMHAYTNSHIIAMLRTKHGR